MSLIKSMIAAQGRNGDTELAHVNPEEKALLESLGGSGTINPTTGLREFYRGGPGPGYIDTSKDSEHPIVKQYWANQSIAQYKKDIKADDDRYLGTDEYASALRKGEFDTDMFMDMSENERMAFGQSLFKGDTDFASYKMGDYLKYMPEYDTGAVTDMYGEAGEEIGSIGEAGQSSLLELAQGQQQQMAQRGFAATGNPMVDRQRENIFSAMAKDTSKRQRGLQDQHQQHREDYHTEWEDALFDWIDATNA